MGIPPSLVKETIYTFFPCTSHGRFEPPFQLAQPGETSHTLSQTGPPPSNTIEVVVALQPHFILLSQTQHHQHAVPASTEAIPTPTPSSSSASTSAPPVTTTTTSPSNTPTTSPSATPSTSASSTPTRTTSSTEETSTSSEKESSTKTTAKVTPTPTTFVVVSTAVFTQSGSTFSSLASSTVTSTLPTATADLNEDGSSSSSGMSSKTRNTIIGVVVGIGGAALLAGLGVVAYRIWGRRKNSDESDGLMSFGNTGHEKTGSVSAAGTTSTSPFQSTLENYHAPARNGNVNASSNF